MSPPEEAAPSLFSFARFECTWLNEVPGRRQLLGYLPRRLQRVGGDDRDLEPPTPSLAQEWDEDENTMGKKKKHISREMGRFGALQRGEKAIPAFCTSFLPIS